MRELLIPWLRRAPIISPLWDEFERMLTARDAALIERDAALAARDAALIERDAALGKLSLIRSAEQHMDHSAPALAPSLHCSVCRYEDFLTTWYREWAIRLGMPLVSADAEAAGLIVHRKWWEWCAIAQALHERGMLGPGHAGCGFAVGQEPLASAFASLGTRVLATDKASEASAEVWIQTGQHASGLENVYMPALISRTDFEANVRFRPVDMRQLQLPWSETFDFIWSSCAVEHLGSIEAGWQFVISSMDLVKPGGIAVHTIEFNVSSDDETLTGGETVIYRRQDIEDLDRRLRSIACGLSDCDFFAGDDQHDIDFDYPPYFKNNRPHIKLLLQGHVATSFLLIIRKGTKGKG